MLITGKTIAIDICNTIADINGELDKRLGHSSNPYQYFHSALSDKPFYFEKNLDIFLMAKPIGNSVEILRELSIHNTIMYITARPKISEFVTRLWLKNNGYPLSKIYFTNNKVEISFKLDIDLAIDDSPFELERYISAGIEVLTKEQTYNIGLPNRFNWEDVTVNKLLGGIQVNK